MSKSLIDLAKKLNLTNTDFIRTTEDRHKKTVSKLWNVLEEKKEIYISKYSGWYSVSDEAFYNEDEIETKADGKVSKVSGSKVEWMEEESYFFKLSKWQEPLLKYYEDNPDFIAPLSRKNEVISFVKSGLKDLSISRTSFKWGIPVPNNNKHVIYVWLDALTNYISALDYFENNNKNQFILQNYLWYEAIANGGPKRQPNSVLVSATLKNDAIGSEKPNANALRLGDSVLIFQ